MPLYNVKLRTRSGRPTARQINADSLNAVLETAQRMGTVTEVSQVLAKTVTTSTLEIL